MISFSESLNNPVRYKLTLEHSAGLFRHYVARFISGTNIYKVNVDVFMAGHITQFGILFGKEDGESMQMSIVPGDQKVFEVFATVGAILTDVMSKHPGKAIVGFSSSSDEPSRIKLYDRFAKTIASKIDGTVERNAGLWDVVYKITSK